MDIKAFIAGTSNAVSWLETTLPLVKLIPGFPIAETVLKAAGAITETVANVQTRAAEANIVIHSDDQAEIRGITDRLAAVNDELMAYIDAS